MQEKTSEPIYGLIEKLTPSEIYLIIGATRGCDFEINTHKKVFTARIRHLVFGDIVGGFPELMIIIETGKEGDKKWRPSI